ncbi:MAG: aminotransferase class I/II-fold pyridoxal phosphate-dependent enzyme [Kiritimatiellales bacterium]
MKTNDPASLRNRTASLVRGLPRSGIREFFDIVSQRDDVISLGVGEPDFVTPWRIREAAITSLEQGSTSYTSNLGLPSLRRGISGYVKTFTGVTYNPENEILVTVGVSEAMDIALRALINPGDEVLYHEPCFVSYNPAVQLAYGVPVNVETPAENGFKLTRKMLEEKVTPKSKILIVNFPTNPTGTVLSKSEVEDIASFAIDHDLIVLSDEIYGELTYNGTHHSFISVPGMRERTVYLHGFSKAWAMTGFRLGFACAPPELIEAMMKIHQYTMMCAPTTSQRAAVEALKNPEKDIAEMRDSYCVRRNFMHAAFKDMGIDCLLPGGAFYMFPSIGKFGLSSKEFALRLLEEESVAVVPGTAFGAVGEGSVRCCYATALDDIKEALVRINRFIQRL